MRIKFLILLLILFPLSEKIFACSCDTPPDIKSAANGSTIVFTGNVIMQEDIILADSAGINVLITKYTFSVTEIFKGVVSEKIIIIYSAKLGATCGFQFNKKENYIVYASDENYLKQGWKDLEDPKAMGYWTNQCSRTASFDNYEAEELRKLK